MARKRPRKPTALKPASAAQKRQFMTQLEAAEAGLKTLNASVKTLRRAAVSMTFVGARPMAASRKGARRGGRSNRGA